MTKASILTKTWTGSKTIHLEMIWQLLNSQVASTIQPTFLKRRDRNEVLLSTSSRILVAARQDVYECASA